MNETIALKFDGSLQERHSGACFTITARDKDHAFEITKWLRSKVPDASLILVVTSESQIVLPK